MRRSCGILLILFWLSGFHGIVNAYAPQYFSEKSNKQLRWKSNIIQIAISDSLLKPSLNIKPDSDISGAVKRSLENWENAANIKFEVSWTDRQSASSNINSGDSISLVTIAQTPENLLMFSKDTEQVSARTRVFFNKKGIITEADIVLNPYQQFSTDGSIGTFDLESTLTHEIGHLLGLEHSALYGATMHENSGKNGVFNLPSFDSRTLAEADITAVRAIYGTKNEETCCGTFNGRLTLSNGKAAKSFQIWLEDQNGKVIAETVTKNDGSFQLEGISQGDYQVYSQDLSDSKTALASESLGLVEIRNGETVNLTKKVLQSQKPFGLRFIGFNGQLSKLAVPLNGGKSYLLYLGGTNLETKNLKIGFNSNDLTVLPNTITSRDFGDDISVISFEVRVNEEISLGEYSIFVESEKNTREYIVGSIVIEKFSNPWSIFILN